MSELLGIDAMIESIHRETERYRDSKKKEKEAIKESLLDLRTTINSVIIRLRLARMKISADNVIFTAGNKLKKASHFGALEIDRVAAEGREVLTEETYEALEEIVEGCIEIVTMIDLADNDTSGDIEEKAEGLLSTLQQTKDEILNVRD